MPTQNKSILFIVEQKIIDGKSYFGSSNDLLLISQALRDNFTTYITTAQSILDKNNSKEFEQFEVLKLAENFNQEKIDFIIKEAFYQQTINALLALPAKPKEQEKAQSKILFLKAKKTKINLYKITIFNRADPISLSEKFYQILIFLQNKGAKILPNPALNQIFGDKLLIYGIHYNKKIAKIDLLEGINLELKENKISFKTSFIKVGDDNLNNSDLEKFYHLLEKENFSAIEKLFAKNYKIFLNATKKYLAFHQKLKNDSVLKPSNYFSGVGVVVVKNSELNLNQAIKNIVNCFLAIKQHSQENQQPTPPLNTIIIQQRASEAHLGDLRILFCKNNLQGIFVRVNRQFKESQVNNLYFGGHIESLFKSYLISNEGVLTMIKDIKNSGDNYWQDKNEIKEEVRKAQALYGLLKTINFLKKIKILKPYPIIGIDALLSKDKKDKYHYKINEINLTSPMGQSFLMILKIAVKINPLALKILTQNGLAINLKKHQILSDYFKNQDLELGFKAKDLLLKDDNLEKLIKSQIDQLLKDFSNNFASQTLQHFN